MNLKSPLDLLKTAKIWSKTFLLENDQSKRKRKMIHMPTNMLIAYIRFSIIVAIVDSYLDKIFADARHLEVPSLRSPSSQSHVREKRNILQFGNMLSCYADNLEAFDYVDYGCYCGVGGIGQPVDDTDWCCYEHDKCWTEVSKDPECTGFSGPYMITYEYGCSATSFVHCYDAENTCDRRTCECDRKAVECFANNRPTWSPDHDDLDQEQMCNTTFADNRNTIEVMIKPHEYLLDAKASSSVLKAPTVLSYLLVVTLVTKAFSSVLL